MKAEEHLVALAGANSQEEIGTVMAIAVRDKECTPDAYTAMCNIAKDRGFSFRNIQLP